MDQDFPVDLRPKDKVRRPYFNMKKQGPIKYGTDQENKVRKFFIISLRLIRHMGKEQLSNLAGCTVKYGRHN